jgi:hypothetical protein
MVIVAMATYIIVFNLNSMVKSAQTRYLRFKGNIVEEMVRDKHTPWVETGHRFNGYKPRNTPKESHPSEWWILAYQTRKIFRTPSFSWNNSSNEEGSMSGKVVDGNTSRRPSEIGDKRPSERAWSWNFLRKRENRTTAEA